MKQLYVCFLFLLLFAQTNVQAQLTIPEQQADFDTLRKAMEEAHGGLYRFSTKQQMDKRFNSYRQRITRPVSQREYIALLCEMIAETRDGHMRLEYDEATMQAIASARLLPLRLLIDGKRLMIWYNDTPADATLQPGMEVLTINGNKAAMIMQKILPKLSGDGFIETGKKRRLERNVGLNYWLFIDQSPQFTITAKDVTGKIVTTKLEGILSTAREGNRNSNPVNAQALASMARLDGPKENITIRFAGNDPVAIIRIRSFVGDSIPVQLDSVFQILREKQARALILDLRGNVGGVDEFGALLVSQFTSKPFRYFDRIHLTSINPSFNTWKPITSENLQKGVVVDPTGGYLVTTKLHSGVGEQMPAKQPFLGPLFVLLDGVTFSTAADVTALLHHLTKAVFIGEESGGAYEGNTSGLNALIKLPYSKVGLKVQMYTYWNAVPPLEKGRGVQPHFPIERKTADWLQGIDNQWNKALELASKAVQ